MPKTPSRLDEFDLIRRYFAPLAAGEPGAFGLTDDAAIVDIGAGERIVVTTDAMVAGVHFPAGDRPSLIARKLLRVNLSDLAAMGARPRGYTLAAALTRDTDGDWLADFVAGLAIDQVAFGIGLLGGDTVMTPGPPTFSLTALGVVTGDGLLRRNGARPGDDIYVSGTIGDAFLGLAIVEKRIEIETEADRDFLVERFQLPEPRLSLGRLLVGVATAAADVSDGLVADLEHICTASSCSATIEMDAVPLSKAAAAVTDGQSLRHNLLTGGDDYEIVFAAPAIARNRVERISQDSGVRLTRIGSFVEPRDSVPRTEVLDGGGNRIDLGYGGYRHFHGERGEGHGG